jgi:hypothetical protein
MLLRTVDDGVFHDIRIEEGEMFLLPGGIPLFLTVVVFESLNEYQPTHLTTPSAMRIPSESLWNVYGLGSPSVCSFSAASNTF